MKTYALAHVVERNNSWEVKSINYMTEPGIIKPNRKYIELHNDIAKVIEKHLSEGKTVDIPVGVKKVTEKNIVVTKGDTLQVTKEAAHVKITSRINELLLKMNFMDLYDFLLMNNKFNSMGIFIHEGNQEEEYLKIINTGDEQLIGYLEDYLDTIEILNSINRKYKKFKSAIEEIWNSESEEKVNSVLTDYPDL